MRRGVFVLVVAGLVALSAAAGAVGQDPGLSQQWGLAQIGAPSAWGRSLGQGVPIAIVDTGVDVNHEDLKGQIMARVTCVDTGGLAKNCVVGDGEDIEGHGTHVAGIAAAASNNVGVVGVAPGARIVAVRVFQPDTQNAGKFFAKTDDINAGIRWVVANIAPKGVINLSLGEDYLQTTLWGADYSAGINEAWSAGWATALAAGNDNQSGVESQNYRSLNAMVVAATGPDDKRAKYSSDPGSTAKWSLAAPGGYTASNRCDEATCILSTYKGNLYATGEGTSMATPHVSGALALLMSGGMTNAAAVDRIMATKDNRVSCGVTCTGRLDVNKAVPAEWKVSSSPPPTSPSTTVRPGPTATTSKGAGGSSSPTSSTSSSSSAGAKGAKPSPASGGVVVVAPPPTTVATDTTSSTSGDVPASTVVALPGMPSSSSGGGGGSTAVVVLAALALAAIGATVAGVVVRRRSSSSSSG